MSRCVSCNRIMKRCDLEIFPVDNGGDERGLEEDMCLSCRQVIFKHSDDSTEISQGLGFSIEETALMEEGLYLEYRNGRIDE